MSENPFPRFERGPPTGHFFPMVASCQTRPIHCDRHAPKDGVGWLMSDIPTAHAQWVEVDTRLNGDEGLRGI